MDNRSYEPIPFPRRKAGWAAVERYLGARRAPATKRAYAACFRAFLQWSDTNAVGALPVEPRDLAVFLAELADRGYAVSTLRRYSAAIGEAHASRGLADPGTDPLIRDLLGGVARSKGVLVVPKAALSPRELRGMVLALADTPIGVRDRAILLIGFAAALRRSEIAALEIEDIEFTEDGLELTVRRSKADQRGAGQTVFVPKGRELCPVEALKSWLEIADIDRGPIFRRISRGGRVLDPALSAQGIATAVKRAGEKPMATASLWI